MLSGVHHQSNIKDSWTYCWGNGNYQSTNIYRLPYQAISPPAPIRNVWTTKCSKKIKVFMWLLFKDRLNKRNILRRKNQKMEGNDYKVLCALRSEETAFHLFFSFSLACWLEIGISWNRTAESFSMVQQANTTFQQPFFMEIFAIAAWQIWKLRNAKIFQRERPSPRNGIINFCDSVHAQMHRMSGSLNSSLSLWTSSFV